jgi:hypothetical protein
LVAEGVIRVAIEACYPLDRVREALVHAGRPERTGKILLLPNLGLLDATGNRVGLIPCSTRHTSLFQR